MMRSTSSVDRSNIVSQSKTSRPAALMRSLRRQGIFRARAALSGTQAHCVHEPSGELGIGHEITAQLAFDRAGLAIARTPSTRRIRPLAALCDAVEKRFPGSDGAGSAARRQAVCLNALDHAGPLGIAERSVSRDSCPRPCRRGPRGPARCQPLPGHEPPQGTAQGAAARSRMISRAPRHPLSRKLTHTTLPMHAYNGALPTRRLRRPLSPARIPPIRPIGDR